MAAHAVVIDEDVTEQAVDTLPVEETGVMDTRLKSGTFPVMLIAFNVRLPAYPVLRM